MLQKLWEELKLVKLSLGCHHQKVIGNGPFSIPQPARLICKGRLNLRGWIYTNLSDVRARASRLWGRAILGNKLGGMGGFWASWAPPEILRVWLGTTRGSQGHPVADWHLHSWKWFEGHLINCNFYLQSQVTTEGIRKFLAALNNHLRFISEFCRLLWWRNKTFFKEERDEVITGDRDRALFPTFKKCGGKPFHHTRKCYML